jgi:hypothetical protein
MKLELTPSEYNLIVGAIAKALAVELVDGNKDTASQYNRLLYLLAQNTKFIDEEKED